MAALHSHWRARSLAQWTGSKLTESSNEATDAMVALLHAHGLIQRVPHKGTFVLRTAVFALGAETGRETVLRTVSRLSKDCGLWPQAARRAPGGPRPGRANHCSANHEGGIGMDHETRNQLHALFARQLLGTMRLANTRADSGWRNADGAGVGRLQMTAWDTVRLLWRLQDARAPWLAAGAPPMLSATSRRRLMDWLAAQQLNQVLSSASIRHVPGWRAGIGGRFAHKTGSTESYACDAGRVELPGGGYFLIAMLSSLGRCSAPHPDCATDWSVPRLGAAVERWLLEQLA